MVVIFTTRQVDPGVCARSEAELLEIVDSLREPFTASAPPRRDSPAELRDAARARDARPHRPAGLGGEGLGRGPLPHLLPAAVPPRVLRREHGNCCRCLHALGILSNAADEQQRTTYLEPIIRDGLVLASVGSESAPSTSSTGFYDQELVPHPDGGWVLT